MSAVVVIERANTILYGTSWKRTVEFYGETLGFGHAAHPSAFVLHAPEHSRDGGAREHCDEVPSLIINPTINRQRVAKRRINSTTRSSSLEPAQKASIWSALNDHRSSPTLRHTRERSITRRSRAGRDRLAHVNIEWPTCSAPGSPEDPPVTVVGAPQHHVDPGGADVRRHRPKDEQEVFSS